MELRTSIYLQKGTQSLETREHMTILTRSEQANLENLEFIELHSYYIPSDLST